MECTRTERVNLGNPVRVPVSEIRSRMGICTLPVDRVAPLAASIARHGLLQPVIVRRREETDGYEIVLGERRLAACRLLGYHEIDAFVTDADAAEAAACFLEEETMKDHVPVLQCAYLVRQIGVLEVQACYALRDRRPERVEALLALCEGTRRILESSGLSLEQAEPLLKISDERRQIEAAGIAASRGLSAQQVRRLVSGPDRALIAPGMLRRSGRRATRAVLEEMAEMAERLRKKGIDANVSVHSQNGDMCIQLVLHQS